MYIVNHSVNLLSEDETKYNKTADFRQVSKHLTMTAPMTGN